jgi:catechol 2,3-dioxygenase-like lactoylglutathione lyase family enzyme
VQSDNIARDVQWYVESFGAQVLYQDATWAFLRLGQGKLALVTPTQHPPHVALRLSESELEEIAARVGKPIDKHRDGTKGIYVNDPHGNAVELICYPPNKTVYD